MKQKKSTKKFEKSISCCGVQGFAKKCLAVCRQKVLQQLQKSQNGVDEIEDKMKINSELRSIWNQKNQRFLSKQVDQ